MIAIIINIISMMMLFWSDWAYTRLSRCCWTSWRWWLHTSSQVIPWGIHRREKRRQDRQQKRSCSLSPKLTLPLLAILWSTLWPIIIHITFYLCVCMKSWTSEWRRWWWWVAAHSSHLWLLPQSMESPHLSLFMLDMLWHMRREEHLTERQQKDRERWSQDMFCWEEEEEEERWKEMMSKRSSGVERGSEWEPEATSVSWVHGCTSRYLHFFNDRVEWWPFLLHSA